MFKKQNNMTVMDFTGIYENEKFYLYHGSCPIASFT